MTYTETPNMGGPPSVSWGYAEPEELVNAGEIAVVDTPEEPGDRLLREFQRAGSLSAH